MKKFIVTITYNFSVGREYHAAIPVKAGDDFEARRKAEKKLKDQYTSLNIITAITFEDEE